jgi:hypothetical protein
MQNDADAGVCVDRMSRFRPGSGFATIGGNLRISVFSVGRVESIVQRNYIRKRPGIGLGIYK